MDTLTRTGKRFLCVAFTLAFALTGFAQTTGDFRSLATGNWSAATTWQRFSSTSVWQSSGVGENNPGQVPGVGAASGNVTIQNTHTVTLDVTNATAIASLTVGQGATGILQFETVTSHTLTITGGLTISAGGQFNAQNAGAQAGSIIVGGSFSNSGTATLWQSATRYADITVNGTAISGNGVYTLRNLIIGGAVTNSSTSTINLHGDLTCNNTLTCSAGTVSFFGGLAENLNGTANPTFNNFSIATNSTTVTLGGTLTGITVNGTFTMANTSTFNFGTTVETVTIVGNLVTPQTITMQGAGVAHQLILEGAANANPATFNTTANSGSTVIYNASGAQTVFASANYQNLTFSGNNTKTFAGATTVNGNLLISGTSITVSNATALSITGNLTNNGTGTTVWGGNANTTAITGNILVTNNTTFTIGSAAQVKTITVTGNVQVDNGSTLNVGAFAVVHLLSISGNLTVNGSFNMVQTFPGNVCNVTFLGATSNTVSGTPTTCSFNQITINKGVSQANVLNVTCPITMSSPTAAGGFLTITNGTFELSSASTLTPYYGAATICAATGQLWINNASASVSCVGTATTTNPGIPTVTGELQVSAGTFSYGSGNDIMAVSAATSNLTINGGTVNMYGGVSFTSTSQFNMTSGSFNIYPQQSGAGGDNVATATTLVNFASTSAVNAVTFTGGTLTIVDPPVTGAGGNALFLTPTAGLAYNFAGSTISFGNGSSNNNGIAAVGFEINGGGQYSFGTLTLNNGTSTGTNRFVELITTNCIIATSLVIGSNVNDNFNLNGKQLTLNGTLTIGTGTITGSATSSLSIGGNNTPVMNLPAIVSGNLLNLTINKTGTNNVVNLGGSVTLALTGVLTLTAGTLELGNYNLTLLNNAAATIAGTPFTVANMIATDGTGYLIKNVASAQTLNPIGSAISGTYYYSPMTLSSITAGGTYSIRAVPTTLNPAYINLYWDFVTSAGGKTITATFQYDPAEANSASQNISYLPFPYTSTQSPPTTGTSSFGTNSFTITGNTAFTSGYWTMGKNSTYYSYQTGDWNTSSTWTSDPSGTVQIGSTVPGFNDNVTILSGRTVSISTNITTSSLNLTINSGGFLDMSTFAFTNGFSTLAGQGTIRLASVSFPAASSNTFVSASGGTVEYYNSASFTLPSAQTTYNNLNINVTGFIATQLSNITLNGSLHIKNGTYQINNNTATTALLLTINGSVTVDVGASITVGQGTTNTTTNPTAVAAGGAYPFINYYAQFHQINIFGDFTNNGTVRFTNLSYPVFNLFPPLGSGATSGAASVSFSGSSNNTLTCNGQTDFYNLIINKGIDQTYQLTINSTSYTNFRLFGANVAGYDLTSPATTLATPNLQKALWIRTGTLVLTGSVVIPSLTEGVSSTADYYLPTTASLNLNGSAVIVLTTADKYEDVNAAYSVSGGTGLVNGVNLGAVPADYNSFYIFGNLQVNNGFLSTRESGGLITTNTAAGQLVISGGVVDAKQFLSSTGSASFSQSNGAFILRGRFQRTPTAYTSVSNLSDTTVASLNTSRALDGVTTGYGSFSLFNATNIFSMSGGTIFIYDVCDVSAQNAIDVLSSSSNISVTGGTVKFVPTTGTGLADAANFYITSTASFQNVTVNPASSTSVVTLNNAAPGYPLTVLSNMNIQSGSFNANGQNLTIGGNFTIASGTTYTTGANTTIFNGSGTQTFTVNQTAALSLNNLTITTSSGVTLNFAGTQATINVAGNFSLTSGTMNDNGNSIYVAGNVYNSGIHTGTGKISLNGSASTQTIDGNGVFQNLELNSTNAATAPISLVNGATINGTLTFSQNNLFNIGTYSLTLNANASFVNAGASRYIQCAGNFGDGGITKVYSTSATSCTFPLGKAAGYTPATISFGTNPTTYGSISIVPVNYQHPDVTVSGQSLKYFWKVRSSGFTMGPGILTQTYTYLAGDVAGVEANYIAADYSETANTWSTGTVNDVNTTTKVIGGSAGTGTFLKGVSFIDGDYTAGDVASFGTPTTYYSRQSGKWTTNTTWSTVSNSGPAVAPGVYPTAGSVVIISGNDSVWLGATPTNGSAANLNDAFCGSLYIASGSCLDAGWNPLSNFGVVGSLAQGNGDFRVTGQFTSSATVPVAFQFPLGDFTNFNNNSGTEVFYTSGSAAGTMYVLPNNPTFGNLILMPAGGSNIIFANNSVTINGNCTTTGQNADSWFTPAWTYGVAYNNIATKTITINGNLNINGGAFIWYGNSTYGANVVVDGNVTVCNTCAFGLYAPGSVATNQSLTIGGSLINNTANAIVGGASQTNSAVVLSGGGGQIPVTFNGSTNASITNTTGTPATTFAQVIVNKGSSQTTTLTCNIAGTLNFALTDNWLTLQNGTFIYQSSTNLPVNTVTAFTIPSTAGLTLSTTANVLISNTATSNQTLSLNGALTVTAGNVYVGPINNTTNNADIQYSGGGASAINVQGGNLFVNGMIRRPTSGSSGVLSYSQSGGTVTIKGNNVANLTNAKLEVLNTGSSFTMSAGTLTISRGSGTTYGDLYLRPASSTVTGGTIVFDNTIGNATASFKMDANCTLNNLTITGISAAKPSTLTLMVSPLLLNGNLTLNTNTTLNSNNVNVTIGGNLANSGTYTYGTNLTTFNGATQTITGTTVTNFYDLNVSPSVSLTPSSSFNVNRNLTIGSGTLALGSNILSVLNGGSVSNSGSFTDDDVTGGISMAGTSQQQISGTGPFGRLVINNSAGAILLNGISFESDDLVLTSGILNIQSYNLELSSTSNIGGTSFSSSKMIQSDGVATSLGVTKNFPVISSTTSFTFPVGVNGKYTPAALSINATGSGSITVNPVNTYHPSVLDPTNVLQYYWNVTSLITGFNGSMVLSYLSSDVRGTESSYIAAWLQLPGTTWNKAANDNSTTHQVTFNYPAGTSSLNGDYTAGTNAAIPNQIPTYQSNSNGNWSDNTIWTPLLGSPACPVGGPNGYIVIIQNTVTTNVNYCNAYTTTITGTGTLKVVSPTFGHNFGTVSGDPILGTGTLYIESGNLPAGTFTSFLSCSGNGTLQFGGTGSYTLILNSFTTLPNLSFLGTGTRTLPNSDLTICNNLIINGPTVDNSVNNRHLTVDGSLQRYTTGAFLSGTGSTATVTFAGSSAQTLGGPTGDFNGANSLNNLEINNAAGLSIGTNGNVAVNGSLLLTSGIITTTATNNLTISNTSSTAVTPSGGSSTSFVNGPLTKQINNGGTFLFPIGQGTTKGHNFTLTSSTTGTSSWAATYFTPNPTATSLTAPLVVLNNQEYWSVTTTASNTAQVTMGWDPQSNLNGTMTQNGLPDMRAAQYNSGTSSWVALTSTTSGTNSTGSVTSTSSVNLSATPTNFSIGSITNTRPIATLSPAGAICGTAGIPVTFTSSSGITLNYTLSYNINGVAQTPVVVTSLPYTLPTAVAGAYQLTGFTYNGSSVAGVVDGTIVTAYASPTTSNAGTAPSLCSVTTYTLQGNNPAVGAGLWTIVSGTGGHISSPTAFNSVFVGTSNSSYTLQWTITSGSCTSSSTVSVAFPSVPAQPAAFTSAPSPVCQGSSGNIYTVPSVATATSYSWSYSGTGATITGTGNSVSVSFSATATSGTISVSAINGCPGTGAARTSPVTVTPLPVATFSYAGNPYCPNGADALPSFSGGGIAGTFSSTAGLVFVSTSTGEVNVATSTPGTYTVTNTIASSGGCSAVTATNTVTIAAYGTWQGGTSADWMTSGNWQCNTMPTTTTDVTVPSGASNMPVISAAGAVCRNMTINNGATLAMSGANTLNVYGSWTDNGTFNSGTGTVSFNYTGTQNITGTTPEVYNNLTLQLGSAASLLDLQEGITVTGALTMTTGDLVLGANLLTLGSTATISGGSSGSYIQADGAGFVVLDYITSSLGTAFNIPLGDVTNYSPFSFQLNSGTLAAGANVAIHVRATWYNNNLNTTPPVFANTFSAYLNRWWDVVPTGISGAISYNLIYSYLASDVVGTESTIMPAKVSAVTTPPLQTASTGTWVLNTSTHTLTWNGVTSFSGVAAAPVGVGLPISLLDFNASMNKQYVDLNWATASETNNALFTIERSRDAVNFEKVVSEKGAGNSSVLLKYSAVDSSPYPGLSYYRLKQTDFDGKFNYSKIVPVTMDAEAEYLLYPNPATFGQSSLLSITSATDKKILVVVRDISDKEIYANVVVVQKGINELVAVDPDHKLTPGIYLIVATSDNSVYNQKLVVK